MERTVRKVAIAPITDHDSRRLGFLGVNIISREAMVANKTAKTGRIEVMVSIVSIGITLSILSVH
jgi:hypothetical protein